MKNLLSKEMNTNEVTEPTRLPEKGEGNQDRE